MSKTKDRKMDFLNIIDGVGDMPPQVEGVCSMDIGLCKLTYEEKTDTLNVYLRRPGLLIGKKGIKIDRIQELFDCNIKIIEYNLLDEEK